MWGFTAKLTDYSRGKGLKFHEIPYGEAQRIYEEQAKDKLPLTEAEFREVISAETMVFGRKGLGGVEMSRMLNTEIAKVLYERNWIKEISENGTKSSVSLTILFNRLAGESKTK